MLLGSWIGYPWAFGAAAASVSRGAEPRPWRRNVCWFWKVPILPSNPYPLGALPARFRRQRLLIVGCGDIGLRVARLLGGASRAGGRLRLLALTSSGERVPVLRAAGVLPLRGDLDEPASLARLGGLAQRVLHLAPPPAEGAGPAAWWLDPRSTALARALRRRSPPAALVYASTTGVYGDCQGAWVTETRPLRPVTARAQRRANAERAMRHLGRGAVRVSILRVPGIYAGDRPGGTPRARLAQGLPTLRAEDDVFTNHIHADDLARACLLALWRGRAQRAYNIADASAMKLGEYLDFAADLYGLPRPPRMARARLQERLTPARMGFLGESRRLVTRRMEQELRLRLRWPTVREGLQRG